METPIMAKASLIAPVLTAAQIARFWSRVAVRGPDDCWLWTGFSARYGRIKFNSQTHGAHVVARFIATGEWPNGLYTCHSCDVRLCCNPAHLWLGTILDNRQDCVQKERQARGSAQGSSILNESQVLEIRFFHAIGYSLNFLAVQFPMVSRQNLYFVVTRRAWKHLP
jgi:hypothetical protein